MEKVTTNVTEEDARRMLKALDGVRPCGTTEGVYANIDSVSVWVETDDGSSRGCVVLKARSVNSLDRLAAEVFGPHLRAALEDYKARLTDAAGIVS